MSFATSIPSTALAEEVGQATQPLPVVFVPTPCPGESSTGASAGVKRKRGRPKGSTKVKKVTAVATAGEQATVNQTDGEEAATHDNDLDSHINDNDVVQAANNTNPDNNNDPDNSNNPDNNNNPDNDNTITSSQTDLYSVLGPDRVDMFYDDGVIYGYDPKYIRGPCSENARDQLSGENEKVVMDEEEEEQEERLLEEERLQAEGADEEEEVYHDGPKPFDEANYPLHFFYEHYFAQHPMDNTLQDTDSDCSASSADEDDSDNDEDKPAGAAQTHTPIMTRRRKAQGWVQPPVKKSRLDQRTRVRPSRLEDVGDVEDVESAEGGEELQQQQHHDQDQSTAATASMQRSGESFEKYQQRMRWDRELEAMKASSLNKAKESNPNKVKLNKKELDAVHLRHREKLALYESSDLRIQQHARGTRTAYGQFHRHWRRWCKRKGYRMEESRKVDFRVQYEKFFLWLREGTAVLGYDGEGDRKMAVLPFFATSNVQVSEPSANGRGRAVSKRIRDLPSLSTLLQHINGVNDLRMSQGNSGFLKEGGGPISAIRGAAVDAITSAYKTRIAGDPRTESKKYATINHADGRELDKLQDVMKAAWMDRYPKDEDNKAGKNQPHKLTSLRARLIVSWKHFMMMRGENIRMAQLPHINFHHFANLTGAITGPRPSTFAIVLIMTQGKTLRHGGCTYGVAVRNSEVEICPVGSLAFYLFYLWQSQEEGKPDLHDSRWRNIYLVHGNGKKKQNKQLSPNAHLDGMARLFRATGIVTNQPTHFYRHSGANHAHDAGASLSAIQIHGGWQPNGGSRLNTHYLHPLPKGVAYAMAGAFQPGLPPWIKRDCLTPPVELQQQIFPFIEEDYFTECPDWLLWTRNIMEGRGELDGRPNPMPMPDESNRSAVLRLKFLLLLVHLRKVLLQDAAALLELRPKDGILYGYHHVFNLPVFKSPEFLVFKERLVAKMLTLAPPQSDSLRHNAPYLEAEFRLLNSVMAEGLQTIKRRLDQTTKDFSAEFKELLRKSTNTITNAITNTIKTVSSVQSATLLAAIGDDQDLRAQAMLMVLQAMPGLYHQSLLKLKRLKNPATAATTVSAPLQPEPIPLPQRNQQSNQATPLEDHLDDTDDYAVEAVELETPSFEQLDAMDVVENLAQVTQDVVPQLLSMQVQSALPSRPSLSLEERLDMLAVEVAESRCIIEFDVSGGFTYEMISRSRPLEEHWEEWFYGLNRDGLQQPSIYWLNGVHRRYTFANSHIATTAWRYVDPAKNRNIYNVLWTFKKAVVRGVLKIMLEREGDIMDREKAALAEVAASIQHTTITLNQFQKMNRKN